MISVIDFFYLKFFIKKVFESVLNPKKEEEQVVVEEQTKETPVEETVEKVEETQEIRAEETFERKKKVVPEEEIPAEERLDRPEGAISLAEYREQLKEKNKNILGSGKTQTLKVSLPSDLKVIEKEVLPVKEKKAAKAKKADNTVQQLNVIFQTEDLSNPNARFQKERPQTKKTQTKAKINFEDLPSLS